VWTGLGKMKNATTRRDATLREFELSDELKEALRRRGRELGVGYQTAAKMILAKYVNARP
jgi:hypothetical protein